MSLTLLAPINLPSARSELVKFEITCSGQLVQPRPTLFTHDSSVSSHSVSTESSVSSSSRKNRPSLSPEALLTHAFGPAARNRLTPALEPGSKICSEGRPSSLPLSSSLPSASFTASRALSRSSKGKGKGTHDYHPQPPPLGTFRSVPKSTNLIRRSEGKLPLSEMMPFHPPSSESQDRSKRVIPCCQCECNSEREPPMSPEIWREKVEERRLRRRLLRLKTPKDEPLGIDCRPMAGSSHVPPLTGNSMEGKPGSNKRSYPSPVLVDLINDMLKKREEPSLMEKDKEPLVQGIMSSRRSSMVELQEIRNLIKQCDSRRPGNSQN